MTTPNPSPPRRRKTDRDWNAAIDAVLTLLRREPMVLNAWGGVELMSKVERLKGNHVQAP